MLSSQAAIASRKGGLSRAACIIEILPGTVRAVHSVRRTVLGLGCISKSPIFERLWTERDPF